MYTLKELQNLETIESGHFDNLKIDNPKHRVYLSRMTVADGARYSNQVSEYITNKAGDFCLTNQYEAK